MTDTFDRPVFVQHENQICEIGSIADAIEFLTCWPENRRGPIYSATIRACHAAHDGRLPVDGARNAFSAFARSVRIREPSPLAIGPWKVAAKRGRMPFA